MKLNAPREPKELRTRIFLVGGAFLFGVLVLAINLYRLMVVRFDEFTALSIDNQFKDVRVRAPRGLIRDRRGEVLVDARPSLDVFITPAFCVKCSAEVIPRLASLLGWDEEQRAKVDQAVKDTRGPQRYQQLVAQVDLTRDEFDLLNSHQPLMPGVDLEAVPHREYRAGSALAHVVGYMNEITVDELAKFNSAEEDRPPYAMGDYIGRRGVERAFEQVLRGTDGWVKEVVNARGEIMRDLKGEILKRDEVAPRAGNNLVLSIDARLQAEAERVFPGTAGAIVVMESKTGFILAMVSRPSFDPNEMTGRVSGQRLAALSKDPLQPMVFRPVAEHYHPGSTFKVVSLLAALRSGAFTPQTIVTCGGGYQLGARRWRCDNERGHGPVAAHTAIAFSCDTYFYHLADVIGIDPIATMARELGFGAVTNLGIAAEVPGVIPDSEYHDRYTPGGYTKGMALNAAIGQGDVNVTPLQMAVVYSALSNGGDVLQPQIVKRIETPEGTVVEAFDRKVTRHLEFTPEQHQVVIEALKAVVNEAGGTGFRARLTDVTVGGKLVTVAGKTGTAQVQRLGAIRLKAAQMDYWERDHAWFASFAPADDPELTVVVLNEHSGFGGATSAPAAGAIFRKYFELKNTDAQAFSEPMPPPKQVEVPAPPVKLMPPAEPPPVASKATGLASSAPPPVDLGQPPALPPADPGAPQ